MSEWPKLAFTAEDSARANEFYGANCGPHALAAVCGLGIKQAVDAIPLFRIRKYTNPTMMEKALEGLGVPYRRQKGIWRDTTQVPVSRWADVMDDLDWWPAILRVQWEGPWLEASDLRAAYAYTHWVGVVDGWIFCTATATPTIVNGVRGMASWLTESEWRRELYSVCSDCHYKGWHVTHRYLIETGKRIPETGEKEKEGSV